MRWLSCLEFALRRQAPGAASLAMAMRLMCGPADPCLVDTDDRTLYA